MGTMASQITSLAIVYSTVYSDADQRKHRGPVNSPHKWPVTLKMFPFDDVIMNIWIPCVLSMPYSPIGNMYVICYTFGKKFMNCYSFDLLLLYDKFIGRGTV